MLPFLNILQFCLLPRKIFDLQAKLISPILLCFSCIIKKPLGALSIVIITAGHTCWKEKGFKNDSGILKLGLQKIVRNVCFHEITYVQGKTIGVTVHISCKDFFVFIINVYVWFSLLIYTARILILNTMASAKIFLLHNWENITRQRSVFQKDQGIPFIAFASSSSSTQ